MERSTPRWVRLAYRQVGWWLAAMDYLHWHWGIGTKGPPCTGWLWLWHGDVTCERIADEGERP